MTNVRRPNPSEQKPLHETPRPERADRPDDFRKRDDGGTLMPAKPYTPDPPPPKKG